jgi:hemoglobin-like flavoprotein
MQFDHRVVKDSFDKARPIAIDVLTKFFEILFVEFPAATRLFEKTDMDVLKPKMVKSFILVMNNLENPDQLRPYLRDLGVRHLGYSVKAEHNIWFRDAFLKSLEYFFGEDWTPNLAVNWSAAFDFIAEFMQLPAGQPQIPFPRPLKKDARLEPPETLVVTSPISKLAMGISMGAAAAAAATTAGAGPLVNASAAAPASSTAGMGAGAQIPFNLGNLMKSVDLPDLGSVLPSTINLPEELLIRIRETANSIVRKAIENELESALEREMKKYLERGIADFLKKSS